MVLLRNVRDVQLSGAGGRGKSLYRKCQSLSLFNPSPNQLFHINLLTFSQNIVLRKDISSKQVLREQTSGQSYFLTQYPPSDVESRFLSDHLQTGFCDADFSPDLSSPSNNLTQNPLQCCINPGLISSILLCLTDGA